MIAHARHFSGHFAMAADPTLARSWTDGSTAPKLHFEPGPFYWMVPSKGSTSTGPSNAMNRMHCSLERQVAWCGSFAGPYA